MTPLPRDEFINLFMRWLMVRGVWADSLLTPQGPGVWFKPGDTFLGTYCPFDDEFQQSDVWKVISAFGWSWNDETTTTYYLSPLHKL